MINTSEENLSIKTLKIVFADSSAVFLMQTLCDIYNSTLYVQTVTVHFGRPPLIIDWLAKPYLFYQSEVFFAHRLSFSERTSIAGGFLKTIKNAKIIVTLLIAPLK